MVNIFKGNAGFSPLQLRELRAMSNIGSDYAYLSATQTFTGVNTFNANSIFEDVVINGNAEFNGTFDVEDLDVSGTLSVTDAATFANNMSVAGSTTLTGGVTFGGGITVTGTSTFQGAAVFNSGLTLENLSLTGTLGVTGASTLENLSLTGTLGATGASTFGNGITVTGDSIFHNDVTFNGDLTLTDLDLTGNLGVTGAPTFGGNSIFNGSSNTFNGELISSGNMSIGDGTTLRFGNGSTLYVDTQAVLATGGTATVNRMSGTITTESLTIIGGANATITIQNNKANVGDLVFVQYAGGTNSVKDFLIQAVVPIDGDILVDITNNSTAPFGGTIIFNFLLLRRP